MNNTPRMNKAANESIEAIYRTGCQIEIELAEALQWKRMLSGWGGTPEIVDSFIKGQQERINSAQEAEKHRDELLDACKQLMKVIGYPDHAPEDWCATEEEINQAWHAASKAIAAVEGGKA